MSRHGRRAQPGARSARPSRGARRLAAAAWPGCPGWAAGPVPPRSLDRRLLPGQPPRPRPDSV